MTRYSVEPKDQILCKDQGLYIFVIQNMRKNIGKNIKRNLSGKYCQKLDPSIYLSIYPEKDRKLLLLMT